MFRKEICSQIERIGIIPAIRVPSAGDARFASECILNSGIPIVEISMNIPDAVRVIFDLVRCVPSAVVGAGSVLDRETAHQCLDAGAKFLSTDGLISEVVEFANSQAAVVISGGLTPTEVLAAWRAASDFVKVVPCAAVGGEDYIRALKTAMPHIQLVPAGGVDQQTAAGYISAGATAIGVGQALIPWEAVALRQSNRIGELARRFLKFVQTSRRENTEGPVEASPRTVRRVANSPDLLFPAVQK
jgi:2-dehydro-3-deoxyphosphogluconate aldolase/(4S)-4-hydroxy-2-oxoglutarate aldolase